jgi:vacuolar protein sorting-associated protein 13A/C
MHIRYEDSQTIPGKVFSAGLTVDSFVVATTDENWIESFVARAEGAAHVAIHKLATMRNLTVYWNTDSQVMANQSTSQWQYNME